MALDILIVDDESDIREQIAGILSDEGHTCRTAADSDQTLAVIGERRPSLVILDVWLQGSRMDGLALLNVIMESDPTLPVIVISGHGTVETAVMAIKRGAYDFIEKPFQADQLLNTVLRATEAERLRRENEALRERSGIDHELTGASHCINGIRNAIRKVAVTGSRVFVSGAAGTGKEVAARLLHNWSPRAHAPFVVIGAAIMSPERVEQELFGEERDGLVVKPGLFEQAHGGTLFLDEVADMPHTTQAKILRVLTDQVFQRVGGSRNVRVDVRVISSSTRDLRAEVVARRFREDLFYRLNVVPLRMPSLVERREDIPDLVNFFVTRLAHQRGRRAPTVAGEAMAALQAYDWPGNVRQLRNLIDWLLIMAPGEAREPIRADMLPPEVGSAAPAMLKLDRSSEIMTLPLREARELFEKQYLEAQLLRFGGNISRTANFVGMERSALHRKLKFLGVQSAEDRGAPTPIAASL